MAMTHQYIPRIPQREENLFLEEYYSGTDVKVMLDGNEQSEISYIQYSVNEQLKPIYGYSSRTFDDVAVGSRIVTGVLKMPIKNPEGQASYDTVIGDYLTTLEKIDNKNQLEQKKKDNTDYTNNVSSKANSKQYSSNEKFEYQNKLISLGYTASTSGAEDTVTRAAIIKYQKDNLLRQKGYFDLDTMTDIDLKIELKDTEKATTNSDTNVYYGVSANTGVAAKLKSGEEFYLIQRLTNDFTQIRTINGKDGFIETSRISS